MTVTIETSELKALQTEALIIPVPEGRDDLLPATLNRLIPKAAHQSFAGKAEEILVVFPGKGAIERIVLVGLGDGSGSRDALELFRRAIGAAAKHVARLKLSNISIYLGGIFEPDYIYESVLTAEIAPYAYDRHRTVKPEAVRSFDELKLVAPEVRVSAEHRSALQRAGIVAEAVNRARDLINTPGNHLTPSRFADEARSIASEHPTLDIQVFGRDELRKRKFEALLAVSQGSSEEPQLITLTYTPAVKPTKTIALVGKGVTFDTGGVNLKPRNHMAGMHMDMAGGAVVLAAVGVAAALELPIKVIGIVPTTENMLGGGSFRPSDVIGSRAGKTIEVADTDAEGRLILADGLDWAREFKPDAVLDIATLTGATIVALGEDRASVMGNNEQLIEQLEAAAETSGERIWPLPLDDDYRAQVKSEFADVRNLGEGMQAGTIAGGAFLELFVPKNIPWAHIDIGGTAMRSKAGPYWPKHGSGWGVKLLVEYLRSLV